MAVGADTLSDEMPASTRVRCDGGAGNHLRAVHEPHPHLAVVVLPENVGATITVEVRGADGMPTRTRVRPDERTGDHLCAVHEPHPHLTAVVLPQEVGLAVSVKI